MKAVWKYLEGDRAIWGVAILLSMISMLAVYTSISSLAYKYQGGNTEYYILKHGFLMFSGLFMMWLAHKVSYRIYSRIAQIAIYITIPLLLFTLISGTNLNSASRWLMIPVVNVSFQTSDLAKLALIMFLARVLSKNQDSIADFKNVLAKVLLPILFTVILIFPANFSTAAVLFAASFVVMFIGGIRIKHLAVIVGTIVMAAMLLFALATVFPSLLPRASTWTSRIENFVNSDDEDANFQADQAKIAIATGGLMGKGPGNSVQKNMLPHPYSDFIFAIIVEEYGFVGGGFVVLLYLILLYRSVRVSLKSPGTFGTFLSIGLAFSLVFQAMINMGVAVNLLPVTGQPLPLVSMGGTSLWFTSLSIGIILSVSRQANSGDEELDNVGTSKNMNYAKS
ncbi:MAG: cell division protein FtsW [Bacteroidetes bacterium]|nr:MAG: cell division protein FtsW [Bacteroidota bacterium]